MTGIDALFALFDGQTVEVGGVRYVLAEGEEKWMEEKRFASFGEWLTGVLPDRLVLLPCRVGWHAWLDHCPIDPERWERFSQCVRCRKYDVVEGEGR
jgi:hypothetical protein